LLKIVMWFNPLIYIYQNRITLLHEYISDAVVVKDTDKKSYFNKLLNETFEIENISFVNQFYKHSLIKKRIMMIAKEKSQKVKQLKYLLLIPILGSMLFYISCTDNLSESENIIDETNINKDIVDDNVPFSIIDESPTFPACSGDSETLKDCLNKGIREHVNENFNSKVADNSGLSGRQKIYVKFQITKKGTVEIDKIKAPSAKLEEEARRVVNSLPKMIPGEHNGKAVNVTFMLPIMFDVNK
jgi:bla regulator protein BlaR1